MRRPISRKAEASERSPPRASMIVQAVSRTTWASLTKLRCASCQAKRTINQCCSSMPINLADSSHSTRHGLLVRHSSTCPCCFQSLESNSICQRSRSSTKASSKRKRLAGASVISRVQSAKRNVSSETCCPRRCASGSRVSPPLVANLLGHTQHQQAHGQRLPGSHLHAQLFHLPHLRR